MAELDELLTKALRDLAAEAPALPPLSPRSRRRIRVGRVGAILASVAVAAMVCAGLVIGALALTRATRSQPSSPRPHPAWTINTVGGVDALAVGRSMLYVATGDYPDATLSAYNRATGHLIHRIRVPALPSALRVGPGGSVWLTFYPDQNGGGTGLWLLSPDLGKRSSLNPPEAARIVGLGAVLPVGPADALVATTGRLVDLHMPVPGHTGRATFHQVFALPTDHGYFGAAELARLPGRIAVVEESVYPVRIVLAGQPGPVFNPGRGVGLTSMAGSGNGLWATLSYPPTSRFAGAVIRLNDRLQVATPRSLINNPALSFAEHLWAAGRTVVVTTDTTSHPLVCFRVQDGRTGPVTSIPVRLPPGDLTATGDTIYAADASGVVPYRLPAICR